jgi:hypothetical protein
MSSRETLKDLASATDELVDLNIDLLTTPVRVLGPEGEQLALAIKKRGKGRVTKVRGTIRRTTDEGLEITGSSFKRAAKVTVIGLRAAKGGVKKGEYIVLLAGGHVRKVLRADRLL